MSSGKAPKQDRVRVLYPWLLSLFPVLHLYSKNLGFVRDQEVPLVLLASLSGTTLVFLALRFVTKNACASGLMLGVLLLVFFLYGHIAQLIDLEGNDRWQSILPTVVVTSTAVLLTMAWLSRSCPWLGVATKSLNAVAAILLVVPSLTIATHWARALSSGSSSIMLLGELPHRSETALNNTQHPDIYYIIADGYSSNRHLLRDYGYDNSPFTRALESLGFFVAYDSKSNYGATLHSLSSSLNMRYVCENTSPITDDLAYLRALIADNEVARLLMNRGYEYVHMMSGYLLPSSFADRNIDFTPDGVTDFSYGEVVSNVTELGNAGITARRFFKQSFYEAIADTTLLYTVRNEIAPLIENKMQPYGLFDTRRFFDTLAELKTIPDNPAATFTLVHLLEPHGPVKLDRHGKELAQSTWRPEPEQFFDELEFLNEHFVDALQTLVERSAVPPIIVLQADHGSDLGYVWTRERTLTHFEIMNAFYLPGDRPTGLSADISPINTFRVLLNAYFGAGLDLLEVKHFDIPKGYKAPFDQVDVTDKFR